MNKKLRVVFMGTPLLAEVVLRALLTGPDEVVAVVCQPDKPSGRGKKTTPPPVKLLALERHIPVLQPASIRKGPFLEEIRAFNPDLFVVAAYGKILPPELLELPPLGAINVHGSLLPKYRGAAPIQWAVINGERETGVTIMQMDPGMDTGDILLPATVAIEEDDTAGVMFDKLARLGGETLLRALALLKEGNLPPQKQNNALATEAPMLSKEQGLLDWRQSAQQLHCLIRGLDPWPSAHTHLQGKRYRVFRPRVVAGPVDEEPGVICRADQEGLLVATGEDYLLIRELQPEGKRRLSVAALLCGTPIPAGQRFV